MSKRLKYSAIHLIDKKKISIVDNLNNSSRKDLCTQQSDL